MLQDTLPSISVPPPEDTSEAENVKEEQSSGNKVLSVVRNVASRLKPVLQVTKEVSDAFPPLKGVVARILAVWEVYDVGTNIHLHY